MSETDLRAFIVHWMAVDPHLWQGCNLKQVLVDFSFLTTMPAQQAFRVLKQDYGFTASEVAEYVKAGSK